MNFEILKHNFIAGWRNILKYKVQNTISVLCLSVGVLFFGVTLYLINIVWYNEINNPFHNDHIEISLADKLHKTENGGEIEVPFSYDMIEKIHHLPGVERILYKQVFHGRKFKITDKNGKSFDQQIFLSVVYPDFLKDNNFRSAITGKKIDTLKPGTLVISRNASKKLFGEDENPIGCTIKTDEGTTIKISDVVYSTTYYGEKHCMYLVPDSRFDKTFGISRILPVIKDGYIEDVLPRVINDAFPEYKCKIIGFGHFGGIFVLILFLLVGGSILITGLAGFLKMQLQLFVLRSREMALRRQNGAKPSQLFRLLCAELFIIFLFVAVVSIVLSVVVISNYGMSGPVFSDIVEYIDFDPYIIYRAEIWVVLFAYLVSIGIAWFAVRRTLKSPLAGTVGKSSSQRTFWNKTMQVVQYTTATSVITIIVAFILMWQQERSDKFNQGFEPEYYKELAVIQNEVNPDIKQQILSSSFIKQKTHIALVQFIKSANEYSTSSCIPRRNLTNYTDWYDGIVTDVEALRMSGNEIVEIPDYENMNVFSPDYMKGKNVGIYVQPKEANAVRKALNIKFESSNELFTLPDGNKYIRVGYTQNLPHFIANGNVSAFHIIKDFDKFLNEIREKQTEPQDSLKLTNESNPDLEETDSENFTVISNQWIVRPTDWDDFAKDVDGIYHKNNPAISENIHIKVTSVYDCWFTTYIVGKSLIQLLAIIAVMCLICVVLTVYSSISLETRGKQKNVAIRKVNGAKTRDIVMLFSRNYIITLPISFCVAAVVVFLIIIAIPIMIGPSFSYDVDFIMMAVLSFLISVIIVTLVTILTVWQKIYKIAHINPAELIKKE